MQYQYLSAALVTASIVVAQSTIYDVDTVTENHTTDVTITSCSDHACATTVEAKSQTVLTTTVNGIATEYTTICPETEGSQAAEATNAVEPESSSAAPAASTVVTTTVNGVETQYTTICPETEEQTAATSEAAPATSPSTPATTAAASEAAPAESAPVEAAPASSAAPVSSAAAPAESAPAAASPEETESDSYVDITTTPVVTASTGVEATETSQATLTSYYQSSSLAAEEGNSSSLAGVASYEGKANGQNVMVGFAGLAGLAAVLL